MFPYPMIVPAMNLHFFCGNCPATFEDTVAREASRLVVCHGMSAMLKNDPTDDLSNPQKI